MLGILGVWGHFYLLLLGMGNPTRPFPALIMETGCFRHAKWVQAMRKERWWWPVKGCGQANGWKVVGMFGLRLSRRI